MGSLPLPPQMGQPQVGGSTVPQHPPYGSMPYRQPVGSQIFQGIGELIRNFTAGKEAARQQAAGQFQKGMEALMNGIPMGPKGIEKLMKLGKKAGMDWLPTEAPTAEEQQYYQQAKNQQTALESQQMMQQQGLPVQFQGGMPVGPNATGALLANVNQAAQGPQGPMPQPQQPSMMQRIMGGLGLRQPQASIQSPMGQFLQQMSGAAQAGGGPAGMLRKQKELAAGQQDIEALKQGFEAQFKIPFDKLNVTQQQEIIGLMGRAVRGDPEATKIMARMSNGWQLPNDIFTEIVTAQNPDLPPNEVKKKVAQLIQYVHMGGMKREELMLNMANDSKDNFGGNPMKALAFFNDPQNNPGPTLSPQQYDSMISATSKLASAYPTAPIDVLMQIGLASTIPGGEKYREPLLQFLNSKDAKGRPLFPRSGTIEAGEFDRRLGFDWSRLNQELQIHKDNFAVSSFNVMKERAATEFNQWHQLATDKNASGELIDKAYQGLANSLNKYKDVKFSYNGKDVPLGEAVTAVKGWRPWYWANSEAGIQPSQMPMTPAAQPNSFPGLRQQQYQQLIQQLAPMPKIFQQEMGQRLNISDPLMKQSLLNYLSTLNQE